MTTRRPVLYIAITQVAEILGWEGSPGRRRALRWLRKEKAAVRIGDRWYTTPDRLREAFPDVWRRVIADAL